ncbi:MAG: ABC transporter permease [Methanomassiliicoccales archaeon]|jgi:ABC-2 type transport system permease protein|nr:ABC transporter permease [Methanomassiliicoccales archaeon]
MAVNEHLRTIRWAAWLGWQMESNWTNPFLFIIYSIIKPITATLILVFMYLIILKSVNADPVLFSYMFIGNAFYMYVAQVLFGITWVVHEDREHYQTLKQIYIAPINFSVYLVGRGISKIIITTAAVIVTLAFGILVLGLPVNLWRIDWLALVVAMILGLFCICTIGIALAGISLLTARHGAGINEGVAGVFYLFCGVIFPITFLPPWGQTVALFIPITYWLELLRRAMMPETVSISGLGGYSTQEMAVLLLVSILLFLFLSLIILRYADFLARKKGKLDMTTAY